MRRRGLLAGIAALLFAALLFVGCGADGEDSGRGTESHGDWTPDWLTETSVEDPGAWFSVSIIPVE